jgi:uncharacterized SAM-binding protein YcdF (DUF218 family)
MKTLVTPIVFVFLCLFIGLIFLWIKENAQRLKVGKIFILIGIGVLYIFSLGIVKNTFVWLLESQYSVPKLEDLKSVDIIVVLGGGVLPGSGLRQKQEPTGFTYSRTALGVETFKQSSARYLVFSGDQVAHVMKDLALALGVPEHQVIVESRSINTRQHPIELKNVIDVASVEKIGIVTSALHMPRTIRQFRKHFPLILPIPGNSIFESWGWHWTSLVPSAGALYHTSMFVYEIFGLMWYEILDIAENIQK